MSHKLKYEDVRKYIESFGYQLLSEEYVNCNTKLYVKCPVGHTYNVLIHNFKNGNRCPYCAKKKKHTYDEVKKYIESFGYQLLSSEYINSQSNLKIKCPYGHIYYIKYNTFKNGIRCAKCSNIAKHSYNDIKNYIENEGYELLSNEYKNAQTKIKIKCNNNHIYKVKFNDFKNGSRCPVCWKQSKLSKPEKEIQEYIKKIYNGKIISNDRNTIVNPNTGKFLELDIYLPEINKAIEFNGTYWHSNPERKNCDKIKKKECKQKNIDLLVIEENNWIKNKSYCLTKITNKIEEKS